MVNDMDMRAHHIKGKGYLSLGEIQQGDDGSLLVVSGIAAQDHLDLQI